MRLLDGDSDKKLDEVFLYLTKSEAKEMMGALKGLLQNPIGNHSHISNEDYNKEITVCIYDTKMLDGFSERSKTLILKDE